MTDVKRISSVAVHKIKTWPSFFWDIESGRKTFEIRQNDRDYKEGDVVVLQEYEPNPGTYTGREMIFHIGAIITEGFGLKPGYCVFTLLNGSKVEPVKLMTIDNTKEILHALHVWMAFVNDVLLASQDVPMETKQHIAKAYHHFMNVHDNL